MFGDIKSKIDQDNQFVRLISPKNLIPAGNMQQKNSKFAEKPNVSFMNNPRLQIKKPVITYKEGKAFGCYRI